MVDLLKTARLITTFVVLTRKGKRTCRKLTMLRKMLATTPFELVRLLRPGILRFFFTPSFSLSLGSLASAA